MGMADVTGAADEMPVLELPGPDVIAAAGDSVLGHMLRRLAEGGDDDPVACHDSYL